MQLDRSHKSLAFIVTGTLTIGGAGATVISGKASVLRQVAAVEHGEPAAPLPGGVLPRQVEEQEGGGSGQLKKPGGARRGHQLQGVHSRLGQGQVGVGVGEACGVFAQQPVRLHLAFALHLDLRGA